MARPAFSQVSCRVPDCEEKIPRTRLMCLAHWREVPKALQQEVNRAWRRYARGEGDLEQLLESQDAAVKAVTGE